jgi:CRP-like cAMP-binding protein
VALTHKHVFYEPGQPIPYVHFVTRGVASLLAILDDGEAVEVSTIGHEGMVGLPLFLGSVTTPGRSIMQVPGEGLRMSAEVFTREVRPGTALHARLHLYTQALMIQMAQSLACNRLHSIEQRCARWLLMTQDRAGSNGFALTQEFLAQMLGVRRAGVSEVASSLQKQGMIHYRRGQITVLDRIGLEARACACYGIIADEYDRLLGNHLPH